MSVSTRSHPVPCRGATLAESIVGTHKTWADDAYCERCRARNLVVRDELAARASARGVGAGGATPAASPAPTSASLLLGDAGRGRPQTTSATSQGLPL